VLYGSFKPRFPSSVRWSASSEEVEECPEITSKLTGLAIREYLLAKGTGSPYDFYKCFRRIKPTTSYKSVVYYFYLLHKAGLIERVGTAPSSKGGIDKSLYKVVEARLLDDGWLHPQQIFYPETRLGSKRYSKVKTR
jgi:hypothetical protein